MMTFARASHRLMRLVQTTLQQPEPTPPECPAAALFESGVERPEQGSPAAWSRKRHINGGDNTEPALKRVRLTRKNLSEFDKISGKKTTNEASVSTPSDSTGDSSTTKTISTTSSGFAIQAYENGILNPTFSK